jgi:ubiquitin thioesterase OTU1
MRFRVRGPSGVSTATLDDNATIAELYSIITEKTGCAKYDVKSGFPPQPLVLSAYPDETTLSEAGIKLNGEQLIIAPKDTPLPSEPSTGPTTSTAQGPQSSDPAAPLSLSRKAQKTDDDPPELPVASHTATLVLRVMPDDNSCLFRAFGTAVLGNSLDTMTELRAAVAQGIQADPELYNEAVLQKSPDDYCRWIQNPNSWGGAIEIGILAQAFNVEVCSINVQDCRIDRFNEATPGAGTPPRQRVILVYSGIHYDVIALSPSEPPHTKADLPAELDILQFETYDDEILMVAVELCKVLQKRHYYTDTQSFSIKCNTCGWTGNGEKDATLHAQSSGHTDFGEA